jgi:hypothetical protein
MKLSSDNIFYKVVYYHIIYMCDFLKNLDDFFYRGLHGFCDRVDANFVSFRCCTGALTQLDGENLHFWWGHSRFFI